MDSCHQISPTNCNNGNTNSSKTFQVVVVLIPFPAQGHLNQLLHLSRLISSHNILVHYVATASHIRQATLRAQGWDLNSISNIHFQDFKVPPFASPPPNPYNNAQTKFPSHLVPSLEACSHLRQPVASFLQSLSCVAKRVIVIHDSLMASVAQDAKNIANVENYTFHSTSAFNTSLYIWEEMGKSSLSSIEGLRIPKVPSLEGCFIPQFLDFVGAQYECLKFNDGNIFNTSRVIESSYLELMERVSDSKKIWALGPFIPLTIGKKSSKGKHLCMEWLDKQEPNSVIYVSFGTTTSFTREEIE
ncbi:hypothetical protein RJT34_23834 [Clitoria ternatea]|uniref:Glycosyltransferase N-terminal domain-containing protein n=1 Tax=Clitoria ternatea TaxID=43366 RepID=A0AAN9IFB8_CLITE